MALEVGTRLGHYDVTALIGEGGMGQVYQATDTKLHRDVALKVLPQAFTDDPDRLARFEREATVLASLNHPNIGHIYGLEEADGQKALVLELVEGPTLADRIAQGPIPIDEALPIAKQIAEALEAAHEQGVIHRDLKPANIKVKDDGTVKVLDFGLAKALAGDVPGADLSQSPTVTATVAGTREGVILGTAAYMSPEQARGKPLDRRTDIWSFGCVLYEVLTGRSAFLGETLSDTIAKILEREPDWQELPENTSGLIRKLLRRCLDKNSRERLRDIGDARVEIREAMTGPVTGGVAAVRPAPRPSAWRQALPLALGISAVAVVIMGLAVWSWPEPASSDVVHFTLSPDGPYPLANTVGGADAVISPDGRQIAYLTGAELGEELRVRSLAEPTSVVLVDEGDPVSPFFSPDGAWVGFFDYIRQELRRVPVGGGAVLTICRSPSDFRGASWRDDNTIIFGTTDTGLWQVAATGGEPRQLTAPNAERGERNHRWPEGLPGGQALLFTITGYAGGDEDNDQIAVLSLETGEWSIALRGGSNPHYLPTGHVVYAAQGDVRAVPFDLERLEATGPPISVLEGVFNKGNGAAGFSVSDNGSLVYVPRRDVLARSLVWVDREGREEQIAMTPRPYGSPRRSPDGRRLVVGLEVSGQHDLWQYDLDTLVEELFTPAAGGIWPLWSRDGSEIVFSSARGGGRQNLYVKSAGGLGGVDRLPPRPFLQVAAGWSGDGETLVVAEVDPVTGPDIATLRFRDGSPAKKLLQTDAAEGRPSMSPDGRWIAYESNESGMQEIYVRPFPDVESGQWLVSAGGGDNPLWGPDGHELFYRGPDGVMVVEIRSDDRFERGRPRQLFPDIYFRNAESNWDISPDGRRFLMIKDDETPARGEIRVVLNWAEELEQLVPTN